MTQMIYTPLQLKTSYTLLSSLIRIPNLIKRAKSLGYQALAITDHNNMFGVPTNNQECKKNNIKQTKPILSIYETIWCILKCNRDLYQGKQEPYAWSTAISRRKNSKVPTEENLRMRVQRIKGHLQF